MPLFQPCLNNYHNAHIDLWEMYRERFYASFAARQAWFDALDSAGAVRTEAARVRTAFLDAIGSVPEVSGPVEAEVTGTLERDAYRIEKVVFQSLPGMYVTALLYLPHGVDAPIPGVLFLCGHSPNGPTYPSYQRACQALARNGFAVLGLCPPGQGERASLDDPETGQRRIGPTTSEHSYEGQQCILTGSNICRYFLADCFRGADYLASRPEVDGGRIGVTGSSGGGTQITQICMTGDARFQAAAPHTYVTSREAVFRQGMAQDAEQLQFGLARDGLDFDAFFLPYAPRPLLIGVTQSDFFPIEGALQSYRRVERYYELLGQPEHVQMAAGPGPHNYSRELRQATVRFMARHLMDAESDYETLPDDAFELESDEDLQCTASGKIWQTYADARTPYHENLDLIPTRPQERTVDELRAAVVQGLRITERLARPTPQYPRLYQSFEQDGLEVTPLWFRSEPNLCVSGGLVKASARPRACTLLLTPNGTENWDVHWPRLKELAAEHGAAMLFDPRGIGAVQPHAITAHPWSDDNGQGFAVRCCSTRGQLGWYAYVLGESLLGMRVFDVLRAAVYLADLEFGALRLEAHGLEPGLWGYLAAALDPAFEHVRIDGLLESFEAVVRTRFYRTDFTPTAWAHGLLKHFDLPELRACFAGRTLEIAETSAGWDRTVHEHQTISPR